LIDATTRQRRRESKSTSDPARIQSIEARKRSTSDSCKDCVVDFVPSSQPPAGSASIFEPAERPGGRESVDAGIGIH
jgi:hypothetical protein